MTSPYIGSFPWLQVSVSEDNFDQGNPLPLDLAAPPALPSKPMAARVACYLRVSTGKQAESDLSIPDQRRQIDGYCASRGWTMVEDYVEPGSSATDDRRPAFQAMIDAALATPPAFNVILVHSFSRFFRDQFQFERYARKLARNGVRIVSITQDMGGSPMGTMLRQIVTLFDEYQSKENPDFDLDTAIANTLWHDARRYRVSITIGDTHNNADARAKLFKGFNDSAPGAAARRRADTIYLPAMRSWMASFAARVIVRIKTIANV
jgi:Resolvase, N terminal domain